MRRLERARVGGSPCTRSLQSQGNLTLKLTYPRGLLVQTIGKFRRARQLDPCSVSHRSVKAMLSERREHIGSSCSERREHILRENPLAQPSLIPPGTDSFDIVRYVTPEQVARFSVQP